MTFVRLLGLILFLFTATQTFASSSTVRPSGANTSYGYEDTGTLDTLAHALGGGAAVNYGLNYNRALQTASGTTDNDLYAWTNHYNVTRTYTANGLDQYSQIMGDTPVSDTRGNLAAYRGSSDLLRIPPRTRIVSEIVDMVLASDRPDQLIRECRSVLADVT